MLVNHVYVLLVYHEDVNAPQRHNRHKEEPKARPLRVGDTEKPGLEGNFNYFYSNIFLYKIVYIH